MQALDNILFSGFFKSYFRLLILLKLWIAALESCFHLFSHHKNNAKLLESDIYPLQTDYLRFEAFWLFEVYFGVGKEIILSIEK